MKVQSRCPTCIHSTRKGLLWLGGGDWLECPDCGGTTIFECQEERIAPVERTISVGGLTISVPRHHPLAEKMFQEFTP